MNREDLYALTHAAMYLSDFGSRAPAPGDAAWTGALSAWRLLKGDYDLAAELTLAALLIDSEKSHHSALCAVSILDAIADRLGYLPSPTFDVSRYEALGLSEPYMRHHAYHTSFVYTLLNNQLLRSKIALGGDRPAKAVATIPGLDSEASKPLHERIAHTHESWLTLMAHYRRTVDGQRLLRDVLDAHLVEATSQDDMNSLLQVIGMGKLSGPSVVEVAAQDLVEQRSILATHVNGRL